MDQEKEIYSEENDIDLIEKEKEAFDLMEEQEAHDAWIDHL